MILDVSSLLFKSPSKFKNSVFLLRKAIIHASIIFDNVPTTATMNFKTLMPSFFHEKLSSIGIKNKVEKDNIQNSPLLQ